MARRLPGIRRRLELAAVELFEERGFDATTGAQIAARAGTTERTFYRHFSDKADAAFGDETRLREELGEGIRAQAPGTPPWLAVRAGLDALAQVLDEHPDDFRRRSAVVAANRDIRDRELARGADWTDVVVSALADRGVDGPTAQLCAALGLILFRVAAERWTSGAYPTLRAAMTASERDASALLSPAARV